ncbi:hypothetical protein Q765_10300 [Flavobacterium rivuli WB 3.3-2 = DSM 21788]|uniref:Uncharacterized protein n=2 Tax=Flavobacterium rivuli TaxID=498301 RepID=A0A0A2M4S6_9FLAO|nr:hypothetical protein Q765_10300 [Flavobacterium rivuli WB 3.3-2 = DSM 21788]
MVNYSSWPKKKINTTSLRLDLNNPRLSDFTKKLSQAEIIDYLIEKEKIYQLAMDIVTKGYFLNELPIVIKEKEKYHVLEERVIEEFQHLKSYLILI